MQPHKSQASRGRKRSQWPSLHVALKQRKGSLSPIMVQDPHPSTPLPSVAENEIICSLFMEFEIDQFGSNLPQ